MAKSSTKIGTTIVFAATREERDFRLKKLRGLAALVSGTNRNGGSLSQFVVDVTDLDEDELKAIGLFIKALSDKKKMLDK